MSPDAIFNNISTTLSIIVDRDSMASNTVILDGPGDHKAYE